MNVGPTGGIVGSAAGAPLSKTTGAASERLQKDSAVQQRQVESEQQAEKSSGVGQTEEDQHASDRDADGRDFWKEGDVQAGDAASSDSQTTEPGRRAKDPHGVSGNSLDLTG